MPMLKFKKICKLAKINLNFIEQVSKIGLKGDKYCRNYLNLSFPIEIDIKWAYFSQLINTDGHISKNLKTVEIANNDINVLKDLKHFLNSLGIKNQSIYEKDWNKGKYYKITNRSFTRLFSYIFNINPGKKFDKIRIPEIIVNSQKDVISAALRGAFDGDGCVVKRTRKVNINSKSRKFIQDIHTLLSLFNIFSHVRGPDERGRYLCEITGYENIKNFKNGIGFNNEKRSDMLKEIELLLSKYPQYPTKQINEIIFTEIEQKGFIDTRNLSVLLNRSEEVACHHLRNLYNIGKLNRTLNRTKIGKKYEYSGVKNERIVAARR